MNDGKTDIGPIIASNPEGDLEGLWRSFRRHLVATNRSRHTIITYETAIRKLDDFLAARGMPRRVAHLTREHVEAFITDQLAVHADTSARTRFAALRSWFNWMVEDGELTVSPMARMHAPKLAEKLPPVLTPEHLRALFKTCSGRTFEDRRDTAILWLFVDTGMRRAEMAGLTIATVDLDRQVVTVKGKGNRQRLCPFGPKTAVALDRYARMRAHHRSASLPNWWLGKFGPLTDVGVYRMVQRRARQAKIPRRVYVHLFRHTFADRWLEQGGQEGDLMRIAGWRSRELLNRYGAARADYRAIEAYRRLDLNQDL